jgi:hypothetical protein
MTSLTIELPEELKAALVAKAHAMGIRLVHRLSVSRAGIVLTAIG